MTNNVNIDGLGFGSVIELDSGNLAMKSEDGAWKLLNYSSSQMGIHVDKEKPIKVLREIYRNYAEMGKYVDGDTITFGKDVAKKIQGNFWVVAGSSNIYTAEDIVNMLRSDDTIKYLGRVE